LLKSWATALVQPLELAGAGEVLAQLGLGAGALGLLEDQRDDLRHGRREFDLGARPRADVADVLVAQHAEHPPVAEHRRVEHRGDAVRAQVRIGELGGQRVVDRVVGHDRPALFERVAVDREAAR
jgi:hypothetical protein